jgi:hypothetical protein
VSGIAINTVPAGGLAPVNSSVFTGIVPLGYSNWDGITASTTLVSYISSISNKVRIVEPDWYFYYDGPTGSCSFNGKSGSANVGLFPKGMTESLGGTWPSSNPFGVSYSVKLVASCGINNGIVALVKNLNALSIGAQYGTSFWYVQRKGWGVMPWVGVVFGSATVFSGSPPSGTWTLVTTGTAAATATQMTMAFQGRILDANPSSTDAVLNEYLHGYDWAYDVGIGPLTVNGQMAVPLPSNSTGLIDNEFSSFDDYFTFGPMGTSNRGYLNVISASSSTSTSYSIGPWTIVGKHAYLDVMHATGLQTAFGATAQNPFGLQVSATLRLDDRLASHCCQIEKLLCIFSMLTSFFFLPSFPVRLSVQNMF